MTKRSVRRQSFTLVEIIAVLLVIAILAAVAAPKFINMATDARDKIAMTAVGEVKSTLNVAYARLYLASEGVTTGITGTAVVAAVPYIVGTNTIGDMEVSIAVAGNVVTITGLTVNGTGVTTGAAEDTWTVPTN